MNTVVSEDFDLRVASGQQQLPKCLHDGTGQAWVSILQTHLGDYNLSSRYDFGRAAVFDDFRAGWLSIRPLDKPPCAKTLARNLKKPIGATIHREGNFSITYPNTAYHLGVLSTLNYCDTQY